MTPKKFQEYCSEYGVKIITKKDDKISSAMNELMHCKLGLHSVDFGCNFDDKGRCVSIQQANNPYSNNNRCCCCSCASSLGYLQIIRERDIPEYAKSFKPEYGFWTKKGCALRHDLRSVTCVSFACYALDPDIRRLVSITGSLMRFVEHKIRELCGWALY